MAFKSISVIVFTGVLCLLMNLTMVRQISPKVNNERFIKEYKQSFQHDKPVVAPPPIETIKSLRKSALENKVAIQPLSPPIETDKAVEPSCEIDFKYNNNYKTRISKSQWDYMIENDLCLSFKHQNEFVMRKDKLIAWINKRPEKKQLIYGPIGVIQFAVVVNDKYAFRHIYKNGGTTVNLVMKNRHIGFEDVGNRTLLATVRDPIDHFLSGWAECGFRSKKPDEDPAFAMDVEINQRIQSWLRCIKKATFGGQDDSNCPCAKHSYPQANFLLDPNDATSIDPQVGLVGDLREIVGLFKMIGFTYDGGTWPMARAAARNLEKTRKYPADPSLLSDETIRLICEFVILDYYLFAFEPPEVCRDQIESDIVKIDKVPL